MVAEIFASGDQPDKVATEWYHKFQQDDAAAVTDLVNCILLSAGCDQLVTDDDIQDPENASNRLADLQNVYTEVRLFCASMIAITFLILWAGGHHRLPFDVKIKVYQTLQGTVDWLLQESSERAS